MIFMALSAWDVFSLLSVQGSCSEFNSWTSSYAYIMMSDSSQTLCKIPIHSINLTHLILMFVWLSGSVSLCRALLVCQALSGSVMFCLALWCSVRLCGTVWLCDTLSGSVRFWLCQTVGLSGSVMLCLALSCCEALSGSIWLCYGVSCSVWLSLTLWGLSGSIRLSHYYDHWACHLHFVDLEILHIMI